MLLARSIVSSDTSSGRKDRHGDRYRRGEVQRNVEVREAVGPITGQIRTLPDLSGERRDAPDVTVPTASIQRPRSRG